MTNNSHELLCAIALTQLSHYSLAAVLQLYRTLGSAKAVIDHRHDIRDIIPDARPRFVEALSNIDDSMKRAEMELEYDFRNGIKPLTLNDAGYPQRLKECADAPLVLFYKGSADLNALRVVNIVGTRHCTTYGQDLIRHFVADLQQACPGVLIVSGLAYGVDICAHREALKNGCDTVGVLAHGLDTLYPSLHRDTAERMVGQGGLLSSSLRTPMPTNATSCSAIVSWREWLMRASLWSRQRRAADSSRTGCRANTIVRCLHFPVPWVRNIQRDATR